MNRYQRYRRVVWAAAGRTHTHRAAQHVTDVTLVLRTRAVWDNKHVSVCVVRDILCTIDTPATRRAVDDGRTDLR